MSDRYSVLVCDIDDPESIKAVGTIVKERALKGVCSYFELQTRLAAARIVVECNPAFGTQVQILEDEEVIGKVMSSNGATWHRYLKVDRPAFGMERGLIAHKILAIINAVESKIPEERLRGYDMIIFYLKEGYVPSEDSPEMLREELVKYLRRKQAGNGEVLERERERLPHVRMKLDETAAATYLSSLKAAI